MRIRGWPGNSGEPPVSYRLAPEDEGNPAEQEPWRLVGPATADSDEPDPSWAGTRSAELRV